EDGIRDPLVTGVQTCALPIYLPRARLPAHLQRTRQRPVRVPVAPAWPRPALHPLHRPHSPRSPPVEARRGMSVPSLLPAALALGLAPLLVGVIPRTKAVIAGRVGQPLLQPYRDLRKLMRKGAVYSRTTTWVFRAGPVVGLAATVLASALVPYGGSFALVSFPGDLFVFAYLLALTRFFTVIAALDTGSSFEGMGASREVTFSALAEPALLLGLAGVARTTGSLSLSPILSKVTVEVWAQAAPALALVAAAFLVVFLVENGRIPVDDPATHRELTMIPAVMLRDPAGPH